jgi:hypothetical protein
MNSFILGRDFLQETEDMVFELATWLEDQMVDAMVNNKGLAYGDVELDPTQRMLKFLDDNEGGILDQLSPETRNRRSTEFRRDVENTGAI